MARNSNANDPQTQPPADTDTTAPAAPAPTVVFEATITSDERTGREWFALRASLRNLRRKFIHSLKAVDGKTLKITLTAE